MAAAGGMMFFLVMIVIIVVVMTARMMLLVMVVIVIVVMTPRVMFLVIVVIVVMMTALTAERRLHGRGAGVIVPEKRVLEGRVARLQRQFDLFGKMLHLGGELLARGEANVGLGFRHTPRTCNPRRKKRQRRAAKKKDDAGAQ